MFPVGGNLHSGVPQFTTNFGGANTMAQKVVGLIKLQIPAGKATPAPPVGPEMCIRDRIHIFNTTKP